MLLGHISGLPTKAGEDWLAKRDNDPSALERKVRALQSVQPAHRPGTVYEYCNANYDTLGLVVQTVSGQPYGDYIVEHIFAPLGMRHAHISYPESQGDGLAEGYRYWFGLPLPAENMPFLYAALPSGNLMVSAEDLGPYLLAHLNDGSYRGVQLVSSAGMHQLHAHIANNYAMGWAWQNNLLTHNGAVPGFGSTFLLDPDRKIGIAVLWNVNTGGGGIPAYGLAENVWRIQTGQLLAPLPSDRQYATYLGVFSMVLLLELAWLFVSLRLLRSWRTNPSSGRSRGWIAGLSAFIQLGVGTAVVVLLAQQGRPVSVMFLFVPDLMTLSALVLALAFGWGMVFPLLTLLYTKGRKLYLV
jgi:CubicO group peptidase (beta-lactamase class C family)